MKLLRLLSIAALLALVLPPCVGVIGALIDTASSAAQTPNAPDPQLADAAPRWGLLASSLAWALGIAILATMLGWIAAWCVRRHGSRLAGLLIVPLLCPSYLAYHSLGLHRAPLTRLGDLIEHIAQPASLGGLGFEGLPVLVGRAIAIIGLSLWSWPLAMLTLAPALSRVDQSMLDAASSAGASRLRIHRLVLRSMLTWHGPITRSIALLTLVMLGSAVPLHLAQAPTYSIVAWQSIVLTPGSMTPWIASWPLLLVITSAAAWLAWALAKARREQLAAARTQEHAPQPDPLFARHSRTLSWTNVATLTLLGVSLLVPLASYAISLQHWSSVTNFWRVSSDAILASAAVAGLVGACGAIIMMVAWALAGNSDASTHRNSDTSIQRYSDTNPTTLATVSDRPKPCIAVSLYRCIAVSLALPALLPAIMVGHAWSLTSVLAERWLGDTGAWLRDSWLPLALAHLSRFALPLALLGLWMAMSEEPTLRDARRIAGGGLRGWARAELARAWGVVAGAGLACACLSLHEIEASIVLQPAGESTLAQVLLAQLHFARQEEIAAAAILVLTPAAFAAALAGLLLTNRRA
jgi:ABC-type Fe3+ transport system permease subunit